MAVTTGGIAASQIERPLGEGRILFRARRCEMPSLKDFVDAMTASWPVALAIFVACTTVLISDFVGFPYLSDLRLIS
jgi:hypothetical protein